MGGGGQQGLGTAYWNKMRIKIFLLRSRGVLVMHDKGKYDGIHRVFFGTPATNSWLTQLLFIDALSAMSNNVIGYHLDRFIQIDIDDVFVGQTGHKLVKPDVQVS